MWERRHVGQRVKTFFWISWILQDILINRFLWGVIGFSLQGSTTEFRLCPKSSTAGREKQALGDEEAFAHPPCCLPSLFIFAKRGADLTCDFPSASCRHRA